MSWTTPKRSNAPANPAHLASTLVASASIDEIFDINSGGTDYGCDGVCNDRYRCRLLLRLGWPHGDGGLGSTGGVRIGRHRCVPKQNKVADLQLKHLN